MHFSDEGISAAYHKSRQKNLLPEWTGGLGSQCSGVAACVLFLEIVEAFFVANAFEDAGFDFLSDGGDFFFKGGGCIVVFALHRKEDTADDHPDDEEGPCLW